MLDLLIREIPDLFMRKNLERIKAAVNKDPFLSSQWEHHEVIFPAAVTHFKFKHSLGFVPRDIILTSSIGAGTVTFNYTLFDVDNLDITTSAAVTIRFFAGAYNNA